MCDNITKFFDLLEAAGAVTVDDGAMLTDWDTAELTGEPGSQVVHFSWTDGEHSYSDSLTEGGIAKGVFDSDGKFVAENIEGEKTVIRFFAVERLADAVSGKRAAELFMRFFAVERLADAVSGKRAAELFMRELLDSVETLTGIADEHGSRTLADLMYLQNAILSGGFIDHYPGESEALEIARALPSGELWSRFVKVEYLASPV